jgi:hypothetical protein
MNVAQHEIAINELIELTKSGTEILQSMWNNRKTYISWLQGQFYMETRICISMGEIMVRSEAISEFEARFKLIETYYLETEWPAYISHSKPVM